MAKDATLMECKLTCVVCRLQCVGAVGSFLSQTSVQEIVALISCVWSVMGYLGDKSFGM